MSSSQFRCDWTSRAYSFYWLPFLQQKTLVGWVINGIILPSCMGIIISHYKAPH